MAATRDLVLSRDCVIPARLLRVRFTRSGGPGGQNVNRVATKVDLRLDLDAAAPLLGEAGIERVRTALASRLDAQGELCVVSSEHRTQKANLDAAHLRMETLLREALKRRRTRRPTRPTRASQERRLEEKQQRSRLKRERSDRHDD